MLTRRQLFDILQEKSEEPRNVRIKHLFNYLVDHFELEENSEERKNLHILCSHFCSRVFAKLDNCSRHIDRFLKNNNKWLQEELDFKIQGTFEEDLSEPSTSGAGRPQQSFLEIGERAKRKRVANLTTKYEAEELTSAAKKGLKEKGLHSASKLISEAVFTTPTRAEKIRDSWLQRKQEKNVVPYSDDEAVSLIVEGKLSKHQYLMLRKDAQKRNADIYPSYHKVLEAKGRCYPPKEEFIITETLAEIRLQALLDHTTNRLLQLQVKVSLILS